MMKLFPNDIATIMMTSFVDARRIPITAHEMDMDVTLLETHEMDMYVMAIPTSMPSVFMTMSL